MICRGGEAWGGDNRADKRADADGQLAVRFTSATVRSARTHTHVEYPNAASHGEGGPGTHLIGVEIEVEIDTDKRQ